MLPSLPTASASAPTSPLGQRTTVGPSLTSMASLSSSAIRLPSRGAATLSPGMTCRIEPSHMPLWLGPSGPVTPERSRVTVTGSLCSATSMSSWSNARFRNVEYSETTGCRPAMARPAALVMACCSAMPTS